jgi:hypothetical protein
MSAPSIATKFNCLLVAALLAGTSVLVFAFVEPPAAYAVPTGPPLSSSYYITTDSTSNAYELGCNNGKHDSNVGLAERYTILDFGAQDGNGGAQSPFGPDSSASQIESVSEQYALGWYNCSNTTETLILAIGTNNSINGNVSSLSGQTWAIRVKDVANSSTGSTVASQVSFEGGNDIEDWHANTSSNDVEDWARSFDSNTQKLYIDFGSASGCRQDGWTSGQGYVCSDANNSFYQYDYWYLSYGEKAAVGAPEIYKNGNASEWLNICLYGKHVQGLEIIFEGPMTDAKDSTDYDAAQSWNSFWNTFDGTGCAQTPTYEISQELEPTGL